MIPVLKNFFSSLSSFFQNTTVLLSLWVGSTVVCCLLKLLRPEGERLISNYIIFRNSFYHAIEGLPLYLSYPAEQIDLFLYGVPFTLLIAPFALLPVFWGMLLWCTANTLALYCAIKMLDLKQWQFAFILWFCVNELFSCVLMQQYNVGVAAFLIFSYVLVSKKQDFWGTLFIVLGALTKVYGILGLVFFLFSQRKKVFAGSFVFWAVILFFLPIVYTSPEYVINSYAEWICTLVEKHTQNLSTDYTNISLLGMVHRISGCHFNDLWLLVPGALLFMAPFLRFRQYSRKSFQYATLSSVLLVYVLFSSGSENSSYVGAMVAVCLWYLTTPTRTKTPVLNTVLFLFCLILTSLSPTDLFPAYLRTEFVRPYSLKALPCILIWGKIIWEQMDPCRYRSSPKKSLITSHNEVADCS